MRHHGLRVSVFALCALAGTAHATFNMTGRWVVAVLQPYTFLPQQQFWDFVQTGTDLAQTPQTFGQPEPRVGTIYSTTGAFDLHDVIPCTIFAHFTQCTSNGTVAPDGSTFTATFGCTINTAIPCNSSSEPDHLIGWRSPPGCGNGLLDAGEQCDDGNNLPGDSCSPGCRDVPY